jgi:rod shape-determining protein MreD
VRRKIVLGFLIITIFILQSTVFQWLSIASISPNLLLILTVSFGFMGGKTTGLFVGFFSGLIIDLFYGNLFGFYALTYMYIGFLNGFLYKVYYDEDIKVPLVLVAISDFALGIVVYGFLFMLRGRLNLGGYLRHIIFPEMVYTLVLTLLLYRIFFRINKKLMEIEARGQRSLWLRR